MADEYRRLPLVQRIALRPVAGNATLQGYMPVTTSHRHAGQAARLA